VLVRPKWIFILLGASLLLRVYLLHIGLGRQDPWSYRFFPAELALFLLGALSHRYWRLWLDKAGFLIPKHIAVVTGLVFLYYIAYFLLRLPFASELLLIALFLVALPFLFEFQRHTHWDQAIGDLSYPIYISHILVIRVVDLVMTPALGAEKSVSKTGMVVMITVLVSFLLNKFVGEYVNRLRLSVKKRQGN